MGVFLFILSLLLFFGSIAAGLHITKTTPDPEDRYSKPKLNFNFNFVRFAPVFALSVLAFLGMLSYTYVDAGSMGVVKSFGQPVRQIEPGLHFVYPWQDVTTVAVQTRIVKPDTQSSTHDLQVVRTQVTLQYHVQPEYATFVLVNINNDAEARVIDPAILEAIKAVTAKYDAQQLVSERTSVRDEIENLIKERIAPYHIVAENVYITDLQFSQEYDNSIEAKQIAQQNADKAANDLKRVQIEAEQKIAAAKGEAEALKSQKEQITPELLQLRTIEMMREKWDGKLPENYVGGANGALPMFDVLAKGRK